MSLITIRNPRDVDEFKVLTITCSGTPDSGSPTVIPVNDDDSFRRLVVGMTLFEDDSPEATTSNKITAIQIPSGGLEAAITVETAIAGIVNNTQLKFTTATVKQSPLTNEEVDHNFLRLEKNKIDSTGNQIIKGNVEIRETSDSITDNPANFDTLTGNLFVSEKIIAKTIDIGGTGGNASLTSSGNIDVNDIILRGEIDDRGLFEKYGITAFPQHLLCRYNGTPNTFVAYTAVFVDGILPNNLASITFQDPDDPSLEKSGTIRAISAEHNLLYIDEAAGDISKKYTVGMTATIESNLLTIKKVLRGEDLVKEDQVIKIFGVGQTGVSNPLRADIEKDADLGSGQVTYSYKVHTLNRRTGKISDFSASASSVEIQNDLIENFGETKYNRLRIIRAASDDNDLTDLAVLVYRKVNGEAREEQFYSLIAIVDNSLFGNGSQAIFSDYGDFILEEHTGRRTRGVGQVNGEGRYIDVANGSAITDLIDYVPLKYNDRQGDEKFDLGYQYLRVAEMTASNKTNNTFKVKQLTGSTAVTIVGETENSPTAPIDPKGLQFFHNNAVSYTNGSKLTGGLQFLINDLSSAGKNTLTLPAGVYHTSMITLPDNFTLKGESRFGTVIKLPPLDDYSDVKTLRGVEGANLENDLTAGTKTFSNTLIGITRPASSDTENNISIENLTLDGNFHNRYASSLSTVDQALGDNIIRAENSNRVLINGIVLKNSIGGGIFASVTQKLTVTDSDILDNSIQLKDTEFYSPLYAIGSKDINITNNRIRNANSAVELSNVVRGNLVGNTVQNTGTGVITYSSVNLISSPNLVLGPNNELITTTDVLDSEFDSINVNLFELVGSSPGAYSSPVITFLKEGESAHLAEAEQTNAVGDEIAGTGVKLSSSLHILAKQELAPVSFEFFIEGTGTNQIPLTNSTGDDISASTISFAATDRDKGTIQFTIQEDEIDVLYNRFSTVYTAINLRTKHDNIVNAAAEGSQLKSQKLVGLAYQIHATEYTNLVNSNDQIPVTSIQKYTSEGQSDRVAIVVGTSVDLNNFIINRKCILTAGTNTTISVTSGSSSAAAAVVSKAVTSSTAASDYNVLKITKVVPEDRQIILQAEDDVGAFSMTNLTGHFVGFQNKFLIAKGRILI